MLIPLEDFVSLFIVGVSIGVSSGVSDSGENSPTVCVSDRSGEDPSEVVIDMSSLDATLTVWDVDTLLRSRDDGHELHISSLTLVERVTHICRQVALPTTVCILWIVELVTEPKLP